MKFRCLIAEDEPIAKRGIEKLIRTDEDLILSHSLESSRMALDVLKSENIDILFLDIQMPEMTGLSLLKQLDHIPATIITTAYSHYALEGFELDVMDYLLKPISAARFEKAVSKAKEYIRLKNAQRDGTTFSEDYFFIKCESRYEKILFSELLFIEGMHNYVVIHTTAKKYITYLTLKSVEDYLPQGKFLKVQKSFIVALAKVESIEGQLVRIGKHDIPISRSNKDEIVNAILGNKLLKR